MVDVLSTKGLLHAAAFSLGLVSVLVACTTTPKAKDSKECTPGQYVFCRCQDRQEGQKLCNDDAQSFGPCEPCETYGNPEGDLEPGDPLPGDPFDAGNSNDDDSGAKASCGDGVVQTGEDCDDENADDTDGCDAKCKLAGLTPQKTSACPGLEVHVWGGAHAPTLVMKTTGSGSRSASPSCPGTNATTGSVAPDRVFAVVAHKTGSMKVVTTEANYNSFLYVGGACAPSQNTWLACANESNAGTGESLTVPVVSGKTYYVFVDGAGTSGNEGTARVTFSIP
ncbi:MAG: Multiple EGF-like-domain protein 3 precursor [Labilithrix sp.]|nr:Multiple EGF-like-domain protein 3 precursor [Labilithrix sp.]